MHTVPLWDGISSPIIFQVEFDAEANLDEMDRWGLRL